MAQVDVTLEDFIKPSSPTHLHLKHHKLSFIDRLPTPIYLPFILFYQNHPSYHHSKISQHLKKSLSDTLTKFYPLAGRIQDDIFVDCNDSGALYIEAQVHITLTEVITDFVIEEFDKYLPIKPYEIIDRNLRNDISLAVQLSFFDCGGIAIGICISHRIADALSVVMFLNSWAALCRGTDDSEIPKPNFDLGCLHFPPPEVIPRAPLISVAEKEKIIAKRFVFSKQEIDHIKELAVSDTNALVKDPSRVEALSAFICKNMIEVNRSKVGSETIFVAIHNVNLRPKMNLPQDEFAFGNVSLPISAILMPEMEKECHDLVGHLRNAIRNVNDDFVKNVVQKREPYLRILEETRKQLSKEEICYCNFTSWCRFPLYEVDYGWGKPYSVGTAAVPRKNTIILMSTKFGDGIEAWINIAEDDFKMLSTEFLSFATENS